MHTTTQLAGSVIADGTLQARLEHAALFTRIMDRIYRYFRRMLRDGHEAEECAQRTLLLLAESLQTRSHDPERSFNTWMWLTTIFELAGLVLLVVPGLLLGAITFYTLILIADRGDRFGDAWGESCRAVMRGGFGAHLALVIYFTALSVPAILAAVLAGPLGSLVTALFAPLTFGVFTSAYRQVVLGVDSPAAEIAYARIHGRKAA